MKYCVGKGREYNMGIDVETAWSTSEQVCKQKIEIRIIFTINNSKIMLFNFSICLD